MYTISDTISCMMLNVSICAGPTFACTEQRCCRCHYWSEHILKAYADKNSLTDTAIVDLIKNILKNPKFNADDVDTDMLQRLQAAIDSGDLQAINMHKDGDGTHFWSFSQGLQKRC